MGQCWGSAWVWTPLPLPRVKCLHCPQSKHWMRGHSPWAFIERVGWFACTCLWVNIRKLINHKQFLNQKWHIVKGQINIRLKWKKYTYVYRYLYNFLLSLEKSTSSNAWECLHLLSQKLGPWFWEKSIIKWQWKWSKQVN